MKFFHIFIIYVPIENAACMYPLQVYFLYTVGFLVISKNKGLRLEKLL